MRLLFDINHPVQAHVFRPVVDALRARGDECRLVARDKDVTLGLLESFGQGAQVLAPIGRGPAGWLRELLLREARLLAECYLAMTRGQESLAMELEALADGRAIAARLQATEGELGEVFWKSTITLGSR